MSSEQRHTAASGPGPAGPGPEQGAPERGIGRRRFLSGAAAGVAAGAALGVGASAAAGADYGAQQAGQQPDAVDLARAIPFYDQPHQPGVATEPQRYTVYMTFDMAGSAGADQLRALLALWSAGIAQLVQGKPVGLVQPPGADQVGTDTGEATGLAPASLTVTVGLGPGIFDSRFGLASKRPALLAQLPALPSDDLDPAQSGGDLSLQACADDPQVAYHAIRDLARMVTDTAQTRWVVIGFGRASAGAGQQTPRNLLGFKDGTRNLKHSEQFDRFVWLGKDTDWMAGGTYQVVRKIRMIIENWDDDRVSDQQNVFGRTKLEGAPLTGQKEFDTPDFNKLGSDGKPVIPANSHISLAAFEHNDGIRILRRSYNYTDGLNAQGLLDAGLLFIAYMNDPAHFIKLQTKLGAADRLNEYIQHIGSGIFAVPPAPRRGHYIGQALFE